MEKLKYQMVSNGIMNQQINLRLPTRLLNGVKSQVKEKGYGSIQEFIKEAIRDKVYGIDKLTEEEASLVSRLIKVTEEKNLWADEEELYKALKK